MFSVIFHCPVFWYSLHLFGIFIWIFDVTKLADLATCAVTWDRPCITPIFFFIARQPLVDQGLLIIEASRSHSIRHTTLGKTPLDEWPARRRDLYLTIHNTHKRQTSIPPAGFEPAFTASERRQTHALDRAATGIGCITPITNIYIYIRIYIRPRFPVDFAAQYNTKFNFHLQRITSNLT
jgi:hypothetical protein